jgi:hypothetical protein
MDEPGEAGKVRRRDQPKPHLARIFEAIAAVMELDGPGQHVLELRFEEGRLVKWYAHGAHATKTLADYDERAAWLVERRSDS